MPDIDQLVLLNPDHPGFRDPVYRSRRNAIAQLALDHREGTPPPLVAYTDQEHEVWRSVWEHLTPIHAARAVKEWRFAAGRLDLDRKWVPQLSEVNELTRHPGIEMLPVAGLISAHGFLSALGRGVFRSTQYMRHHSMPLYTPEPDVIHELVGHATSFLAPEIVHLSRSFGDAALRADPVTLQQIERVYWYTLEFGVALEGGEVKAYGAGLLSSYGELGDLGRRASLVPFDLEAMAATPYDPTDYQKVLFVAPGFQEMVRALEEWLSARGRAPSPPLTAGPAFACGRRHRRAARLRARPPGWSLRSLRLPPREAPPPSLPLTAFADAPAAGGSSFPSVRRLLPLRA